MSKLKRIVLGCAWAHQTAYAAQCRDALAKHRLPEVKTGLALAAILAAIAAGALSPLRAIAKTTPQGQTPGAGPRFDVVSVKLDPPPGMQQCPSVKAPHFPSPDTWETVCQPLVGVLMTALQAPENEMIGLPDWTYNTSVEIEAKLPPTAHAQLSQMLQAMFADRFQLAFHRATQPVKVRWIEVATGGSKMKPTSGKCTDDPNVPRASTCCVTPPYVYCQLGLGARLRLIRGGPPLDCPNLPPPRCGDVAWGPDPSNATRHLGPFDVWLYSGVGATMTDLATTMSKNATAGLSGAMSVNAIMSNPPWVDHTGLTGRYDFEIKVDLRSPDSDSAAPTRAFREVLTDRAFRSQAGIVMDPNATHKEPFPVVVIDHIAMPTAN